MKIYLAGAMRGQPNFNREAFRHWAQKLRSEGHEVFCPPEEAEKIYGSHLYNDNPEGDEVAMGVDGRVVFELDLTWICRHADAVALIPGWEASKGARAERAVAEALGAQCGVQVIEL